MDGIGVEADFLLREYHEGEGSSTIDNEDSTVLDLVMSEAPYQLSPSSIGSSDQGSLLDPSPPYALSLHEYQTDHEYEEPLILRVYVTKSRHIAKKNKTRSRNLPLVAETARGPSTQEISLHIQEEVQEELYVDLPLVGRWILKFVCWHDSGEIVCRFEMNVESIIWNQSVRPLHQQPKWYATFGDRVKIGFTLLDPANEAASLADFYKKFRKLVETNKERDRRKQLEELRQLQELGEMMY
jgi:hypothetical protein